MRNPSGSNGVENGGLRATQMVLATRTAPAGTQPARAPRGVPQTAGKVPLLPTGNGRGIAHRPKATCNPEREELQQGHDSSPMWNLETKAAWMSWDLSPAQEYFLLAIQAHGTTLQRQQHYTRWGDLDYHERFCLVCSDTGERVDNSIHPLPSPECQRVQEIRATLGQTASDFM